MPSPENDSGPVAWAESLPPIDLDAEPACPSVHPPLRPSQYFIVKVPEAAPPSCTSFDSMDEVIEFMAQQSGQICWCYIFRGHRLETTSPPDLYLIDADGSRHRIGPERPVEVDPTGSMRMRSPSLIGEAAYGRPAALTTPPSPVGEAIPVTSSQTPP